MTYSDKLCTYTVWVKLFIFIESTVDPEFFIFAFANIFQKYYRGGSQSVGATHCRVTRGIMQGHVHFPSKNKFAKSAVAQDKISPAKEDDLFFFHVKINLEMPNSGP